MNASRDRHVRYWMVLLAMMVAVLLYLDRICLSTASDSVEKDLGLSNDKLKWILSAFFWTYAFAQLPAGWLGDRFGARWVLGCYVALWSLTTALLGVAWDAMSLLILRLLCGLFEAGAYPAAAGIVRKWVPASSRGLASGLVSVGGRLGGALAPIITVEFMLWWSFGKPSVFLDAGLEPMVTSWRPVMMLYGVAGIVVAITFVWFYRDHPGRHPFVTTTELAIIEGRPQQAFALEPNLPNGNASGSQEILTVPNPSSGPYSTPPNVSTSVRTQLPFYAMLTCRSLWLMSFVQFSSNLGWAFLATMMPRYLSDVHKVTQHSQGWMQSLTLSCGIAGLLLGGTLTDWATKKWGLRFGRAALLMLSRSAVAIAFLVALRVDDPIQATLCLALVSFSTDLGIGAMWTYAQDVGGKHAGSVLGWSNMWGNIGAALSPIIFGSISELYPDNLAFGWQVAFVTCAAVQLLAAVAAYGVSASYKLSEE